ncbi:MAG: hemerythrin domain-containing protein [Gallionella sp.]|nr:hemerythrin domain-containing protein [Gallionella sp.]MDD4957726.1 hemerythrin domain-containing protein [Gallionella sp.]
METIWSDEWNTGIAAIDAQHRCIAECIYKLSQVTPHSPSAPSTDHQHDATELDYYGSLFGSLSTGEYAYLLDQFIASLENHFAYEENLLREAKYEFTREHKATHDMFLQRMKKYRERFKNNEPISEKLHRVLMRWIKEHISHDKHYANMLKDNTLIIQENNHWLARSIKLISRKSPQKLEISMR